MDKKEIVAAILSKDAGRLAEAKSAIKTLLASRAAQFRADSSKFVAKSLFESADHHEEMMDYHSAKADDHAGKSSLVHQEAFQAHQAAFEAHKNALENKGSKEAAGRASKVADQASERASD